MEGGRRRHVELTRSGRGSSKGEVKGEMVSSDEGFGRVMGESSASLWLAVLCFG